MSLRGALPGSIERDLRMLDVEARGGQDDATNGFFKFLAFTLKFCGCDNSPPREGAAPLLVNYDCEPELVERQREFRKMRKNARDASYNSLASLDTVVDFLERRIEVKFGRTPHRGTVNGFEDSYHHVAFDQGPHFWFSLDLDSGRAQQVNRDADGEFNEVGPQREMRLI